MSILVKNLTRLSGPQSNIRVNGRSNTYTNVTAPKTFNTNKFSKRTVFISPQNEQGVTIINPMVLSKKQIENYRKTGYITIKNIISPPGVEAWKETTEKAVAKRDEDWRLPIKGTEDPINKDLDFYRNVWTQRYNLWQTDETFKKYILACAKVIGKLAAELEGVSATRMYSDSALFKEPFGNATPWHSEATAWSTDNSHAITAWFALDDCAAGNGSLFFLEGSHRILERKFQEKGGKYIHTPITKNMNDIFTAHPELKSCKVVPLPIKAGTVAFYNGLVVRAETANMSNERRRVISFQMIPENATFNGRQHLHTQEQLAKFKVGEPVRDDNLFPILWSSK